MNLVSEYIEEHYIPVVNKFRNWFLSKKVAYGDVEDVLQDFWYYVFKNKDKYDPKRGTINRWLFLYAELVLSLYRNKLKRKPYFLEEMNYEPLTGDFTTEIIELIDLNIKEKLIQNGYRF